MSMVCPTPEERRRILDRFLKEGPLGLLFLILFCFVIWTNNIREMRYIAMIDRLTTALATVETIDKTVAAIGQDIKTLLYRK